MAKCLVLGANGFIGSHLVDSLRSNGHQIRAFGKFGQAPVFEAADKIEIFQGDFLNKGDLTSALQGVEYVFHLISTTTPASAENDPLIDIETNIRMSVELLQLCSQANVKKVIYASSGGSIYGEGGDAPRSEDTVPLPISPYAIGKLTVEHYLRYFKVKRGLDSVVFRISNPYGERQPLHRKQGVIPVFLENMITGQPITVLGDGSMVRDYIYVKDVAAMIAGTFDKPAKHDVYNLGSGKGMTVNELLAAVIRVCGTKPTIINKEAPATYINRIVLDTSRFTEEFGVYNFTDLEVGLKAAYDYIKRELANK